MTIRWGSGIAPYLERAPLAALFLGISSGFTFAMIGATLTTRLAQHGINKSAVTAFALTFLAYNFKFLWAPLVDNVRLPLIGRFGQRRSWLWAVGVLVMAAVMLLGLADPGAALYAVAAAAAPRAGEITRRAPGHRRLLHPAHGIPRAPGRGRGACVRARAQDRRHAGELDVAPALRRPRVHQRRDRVLRRRRRLRRAAHR